jgi:hypothetical protein
MTQRSVAKTYAHLINVKHMQIPLYQSCGVARGEFSTPLFTSGLFYGETRYIIDISLLVLLKQHEENATLLGTL